MKTKLLRKARQTVRCIKRKEDSKTYLVQEYVLGNWELVFYSKWEPCAQRQYCKRVLRSAKQQAPRRMRQKFERKVKRLIEERLVYVYDKKRN